MNFFLHLLSISQEFDWASLLVDVEEEMKQKPTHVFGSVGGAAVLKRTRDDMHYGGGGPPADTTTRYDNDVKRGRYGSANDFGKGFAFGGAACAPGDRWTPSEQAMGGKDPHFGGGGKGGNKGGGGFPAITDQNSFFGGATLEAATGSEEYDPAAGSAAAAAAPSADGSAAEKQQWFDQVYQQYVTSYLEQGHDQEIAHSMAKRSLEQYKQQCIEQGIKLE